MAVTIDQVKRVGIPLNTNKLNNSKYSSVGIYNSSINLFEAIKIVVEEGGVISPTETNITINHNSNNVNVVSDTGADGIINAATTTLAGVMTATDKAKLEDISILTGVSTSHLGTFTGTSLSDNLSIKDAFQEVENLIENISSNYPYELVESGSYTVGNNSSKFIYAKPNGANITLTASSAMEALVPYYIMIRPNNGNSVNVSFSGVQGWVANSVPTTETTNSAIFYTVDNVNTALMLFRVGVVIFYIKLIS